MGSTEVRAAGGVIVRESPHGLELLLVHRPKYDDWSFPKGKLDPGESFREAALREVHEETGLSCGLGPRLPGVHYRDHHGRPKEVRYWLMTVLEGDAESRPADAEVDELCWVSAPEARRMLSYEHDRDLAGHAIRIHSGGEK